jgi:hypothetical protein
MTHALWTRLAAAALLGVSAANAQANLVSLRAYFDSLPATSYGAQTGSEIWTFQVGDANGALMTPTADSYVNVATQSIGSRVTAGERGCSEGYCPADPATTVATFGGVFVHPGEYTTTAAVFHAKSALVIDDIRLWSEMIGNGNRGNGIRVDVLATVSGVSQAIGSFAVTHDGTLTLKDEHVYATAMTLQVGDTLSFLYGNNGAWYFDHGNIEVRLNSHTLASTVPEPGGLTLLALGLVGLALTRNGRSRP